MSIHHARVSASSILRPLLFVTFAATAVACSGGGMEGDDALDPEVDPSSVPGDGEGDPLRGGRIPAGDDEAVDPDEGDGADPVDPDDTQATPPGADPADPSDVVTNDDVEAPTPSDDGEGAPVPEGWLYTEGNQLKRAGGGRWHGRGANIADVRGCNACGDGFQDPDEVIRRVDVLVDEWGADFLRLTLESGGESGILHDAEYLEQIEEIVDHIGTKPGVVVMVANWISPHHGEMGWPTEQTRAEWRKLAALFADDKHVMFGIVNEPEENFDGAHDAEVWQAMNETVAVIREVEAANDAPKHIIAVQGTGGWSRRLDYYVDHPITAGGGENIAYEVHVYDGKDMFKERFLDPAKTLPVIIGEFGPWDPYMNLNDTKNLIQRANAKKVPWLAWTFHMRCPPNLIEDQSEGGCGIDMPIVATPWGEQIKDALRK